MTCTVQPVSVTRLAGGDETLQLLLPLHVAINLLLCSHSHNK